MMDASECTHYVSNTLTSTMTMRTKQDGTMLGRSMERVPCDTQPKNLTLRAITGHYISFREERHRGDSQKLTMELQPYMHGS